MAVTTKATIASFGGNLLKLTHNAKTTNCEMAFNLYLPPQALGDKKQKVPVLIYLSGLTCTAENCSEKGFFQHGASQQGIAILYPDTSPRTSARLSDLLLFGLFLYLLFSVLFYLPLYTYIRLSTWISPTLLVFEERSENS